MDSTTIKPTIDYVVYAVKPETMAFWIWYHTEVEGGRLVSAVVSTSPNQSFEHACVWIDFGTFGVALVGEKSLDFPGRSTPLSPFIEKHGDHFVLHVGIGEYQMFHSIRKLAGLSDEDIYTFNRSSADKKAFLRRPDHVTFVVTPETISFWREYFVALGGEPAAKIDDVMSNNPEETSSMMLWTVKFDTFGVALVAGLDRTEESQVTKFVRRHGIRPPQVQHVAYDTWDLQAFLKHLRGFGGKTRGEIFRKKDEFGELLQIFGYGYDEGDPAEAGFPEYVQRPDKEKGEELPSNVTFSQSAGVKLYRDIQSAADEGRLEPLIDISMMPRDWQPKIPTNKHCCCHE